MEIKAEVRQALDCQCALGEGPWWDAERALLWFVDIEKHHLWHYDPATGEHSRVIAPDKIGWAIPANDGHLLCGLSDGLHDFDPDIGRFVKMADVPGEPAHNRLNDACSDPWGRVWFGSMDDDLADQSGRFYLFDHGAIAPAGPEGIAITNGPAVSPEGERIYFTDTLGKRIMMGELDQQGRLGEVRGFVDTGRLFPDAYPDGPVVDEEGCVWTGLFNGWDVARFSPEGELMGTVAMPVAHVTKLAFGGADLRTAFVTTARIGLDEAALAAQPLAGSLFAFEAPVAGFAPKRVEFL